MRLVPTPARREGARPQSAEEALELALHGDADDRAAQSWRELRADVRSLSAPIDPDFARRLRARLEDLSAAAEPVPQRRAAEGARGRGPSRPSLPGALRGLLRTPAERPQLAAGIAAVLCSLVIAVLIAAPFSPAPRRTPTAVPIPAQTARSFDGTPVSPGTEAAPSGGSTSVHAPQETSVPAGAAAAGADSAGAAQAPGPSQGRVQQLGAAITLAAEPAKVQSVADGVSRLTSEAGGFVQSSQVQVQREGASEATLELNIPSARLAGALAALARLAPVRAQSQSLQDITNSYEAARRGLADAVAARAALLRALSHAGTQGEIESLRRRLALAGGTIERARSNLRAVSRRASSATVEVTVVGDVRAGSEGLTLHRGLHDAGRVLTVVLAVALIAVAVLVPLAIVLAALTAGARAWRRLRRERALDTR